MAKKLNWKPVRRGDSYCSSACGAHCKHSEYISAKKAAERCLKRMKTKNWKISLHENMGWFWKLEHLSGLLTVSGGQVHYGDNPDKGFHAMLTSSGVAGGCDANWFDRRTFNDPNKAVRHRLELAKNYIGKIQTVVILSDDSV